MRTNLFGESIVRGTVLGCSQCPNARTSGIRNFLHASLDRIGGQKVFIWAMVPGAEENRQGMELVGPSGDLLWMSLKTIDVSRSECAIKNVVNCQTTDEDGSNRDPSKRELLCCSPYNEEALERNQGNAVVHLILGDVAGKQLLGKVFKKDKPVFWHEPWNAYVVLASHPAYLLRKGGEKAGWVYYEWMDRLHAIRAVLDRPGRWGYIKAQNYRTVTTIGQFDAMEQYLIIEAAAGRRVSVDIETGRIGERPALLMIGFGTGQYKNIPKYHNANAAPRLALDSWRGRCWSVVLDHPQSGYTPAHLREMQARIKRVIENPKIHKALQNGSSDDRGMQKLLGARMKGYDYDTQYATYLKHSFLRSVSLESLTYRFLPEFCDYKELITPWTGEDGEDWNLAEAPIDRLALYNSGDADVTKRMECKIPTNGPNPAVNHELLQVYIHAAYTLADMETRGPWLDKQNLARAYDEVPGIIEGMDRDLQRIAEEAGFDGEFNCDSPVHVATLLYDLLKLPQVGEGRSTSHPVMDALAAETGSPVPPLITHRRAMGKMKGTYLDGYARSAEMHGGHLATRWFLTGAETTRLRSGSGRPGDGCVNMQNIASESLLKNILISDPNWRLAL